MSYGLHIFSARLSALRISLSLEGYLLPFGQPVKARTLDRPNVNKHVHPTTVRLNKAEALLAVEPLHNTRCHFHSPMLAKQDVANTAWKQTQASDVLRKKPQRPC